MRPSPCPYDKQQPPPGGFPQFNVPLLAAALLGSDWERTAANNLFCFLLGDLVPRNVSLIGRIPLEGEFLLTRHT